MTTKHVASLITDSGMSIFVNGQLYSIPTDHPNFSKLSAAIRDGQTDNIADLVDLRASVRNWLKTNRRFTLVGDCLSLNGVPFASAVTDKTLAMIDAGQDAIPLFRFLEKVRKNPSNAAQNELLLFCTVNRFMIHSDGSILAYKSVNRNFTDIHSGTVNYPVGAVVTMERGAVDDARDRTCSHGLHFAAYDYATTWTSMVDKRLLLIKIDPADVVSIPSDYNNQKGRTCKLEVIAELPFGKPLPPKEVYTDEDTGATCNCGICQCDDDVEDCDNYTLGFEAGYAGDVQEYSFGAYADGYEDGEIEASADSFNYSEEDDYDLGYSEGIAGTTKRFYYGTPYADGYEDGARDRPVKTDTRFYDLGFKHGKAHDRRQYTAGYNAPYDNGYFDGRFNGRRA